MSDKPHKPHVAKLSTARRLGYTLDPSTPLSTGKVFVEDVVMSHHALKTLKHGFNPTLKRP